MHLVALVSSIHVSPQQSNASHKLSRPVVRDSFAIGFVKSGLQPVMFEVTAVMASVLQVTGQSAALQKQLQRGMLHLSL